MSYRDLVKVERTDFYTCVTCSWYVNGEGSGTVGGKIKIETTQTDKSYRVFSPQNVTSKKTVTK